MKKYEHKQGLMDALATITGLKFIDDMVNKYSVHSPIPEGYQSSGNIPPSPEVQKKQEKSYEKFYPNGYNAIDPLVPAEIKPKEVQAAERKPVEVNPDSVKLDPEAQNFIESVIFPVTDKYNIPRSVAAGQFAAEGRLKGLGASRNNFYNIAAFDSNPNAAFSYDTPEKGVEAYAKFVTGQSDKYASPDVQKKFSKTKNIANPDDVLSLIEAAGYAGDPQTYKKRAGNGYASYYDFIRDTPEYKKYLKSVKK